MPLQPAATSQSDLPREAARRARQVHRSQFNGHITVALRQLEAAGQSAIYAGFSDIEQAALRAAKAILARKFYTLPINPDATDFARLNDDLRTIAETIDPLIEEIGKEACRNSNGVPERDFNDCFKDVLLGAIDGNATHVLDQCGENVTPPNDPDTAAEHRRELQRAE
jgi:hypothetical protein